MVKQEKGRRRGRLVLFIAQTLCAFFLFSLLYTELRFKDTSSTTTSQQIKLDIVVTGRQIVSDLKSDHVINAVKEEVTATVKKDVSSVVKRDDHRNQSLQYLLTRLVVGEDRTKLDSTGFACDKSFSSNPPILLLISRQRTRKFLNQAEMVKMMEDLGFRVIIASNDKEMSNVEKFSRVINSCSVMVGAHGAGLANEIFLPDGAVMIQVRPLGFQYGTDAFYSEPGPGMGLRYLEYLIEPAESSLAEVYGLRHPVVADTASVAAKGGYAAAREIYLNKQDLRLNLNRFRETLVEALGFIGRHKDVANVR
ncbi:hypothetical protein L2E82_37867 [Cichorium intybus]|uniref:Uncharacterized protein n=1 Tax=Cichorium intybus TaxID=13427 RepID=A0ACB9AF49_CICIN|nr:hypothetical protein L2E82_37867 [Cichorium intybus]